MRFSRSLSLILICQACGFEAGDRPVRGTVHDAVSGDPVAAATVQLGRFVTRTDSAGWFAFPREASGPDVHFVHLWYGDTRVPVAQISPRGARVEMARQTSPCCQLEGTWEVVLTSRSGETAVGSVVFGPTVPRLTGITTRYDAPSSPFEPGQFAFERAALLGTAVRPADFGTLDSAGRAEWKLLFRGAQGYIHQMDSVAVAFGFSSDGGLRVTGRIVADTVMGAWRGIGTRVDRGTVRMVRVAT